MVSLLEVIPEYVLHWLVQNGTERRLRQGEVLLTGGAENASLYIVLDGLFAAQVDEQGDGEADHAGPGSLLGETSYFGNGTEPATILATEPSLVLEITRSRFESKLTYDHGYAADFFRALLTTMSRKLCHATIKRMAAEQNQAPSAHGGPDVRRAGEAIDRFKQSIVALDKEAMKAGSIGEERYQQFFGGATEMMHICHGVLGGGSQLPEAVRSHLGARLQAEMLPYILTTETADRFYSKPRGYAGDFVAIHKIYMNRPGGSSRLGPIVDRMFLEMPPSVAVRNRRKLIADEIVATVRARNGAPVRVLCLASGPATEVFDAFSELGDRSQLKATLMDIDLQALAFVDEQRSQLKLNGQINLVNENLIALFLGRSALKLEPQDLIYSIGLIDYLNDKLVGKLLQFAHQNLAPGGRVLLGNFHPRNPAKEFMDVVLEWSLIHRTEEDMHRLFRGSPFARDCTRIQFEAQGVNLFAECVKE
jgi:extracellular factor (EF) 3-hydroxypalmitic acid methyl ester biosynthesis protein